VRVLSAFAGDALGADVIRGLCERAYAPFAHQSVAPLVEVGPDRWMLELHHGPTLAFKDVAMRLIAQLYDYLLEQRGERMTILCATSGDTGGAAASAFAGSKNVDIVILHPLDRVSPTQRLFMTATGADNVLQPRARRRLRRHAGDPEATAGRRSAPPPHAPRRR
jgi:threonine synthase